MPNVGDVLLEKSQGTATHALISFGQALFSHNVQGGHADIVHAAIYAGAGNVFESAGHGLGYGPATPGATWVSFRYGDAALAELAVDIAHTYWHIQQSGTIDNYGNYSYTGAVGSLFGSSDFGGDAARKAEELWSPQASRSFFCSNFVIRCYQAAGQTYEPHRVPIEADMATSPKELFARLAMSGAWTNQGEVVF